MSSRRQPQPSHQAQRGKTPGAQQRSGGLSNRLERLRVPERTVADAAPGMRSISRRQQRIARKKQGMTKWQVFSIAMMLFLGLIVIVSTFLPYVLT
jgi:hypothetical protein